MLLNATPAYYLVESGVFFLPSKFPNATAIFLISCFLISSCYPTLGVVIGRLALKYCSEGSPSYLRKESTLPFIIGVIIIWSFGFISNTLNLSCWNFFKFSLNADFSSDYISYNSLISSETPPKLSLFVFKFALLLLLLLILYIYFVIGVGDERKLLEIGVLTIIGVSLLLLIMLEVVVVVVLLFKLLFLLNSNREGFSYLSIH